MATFWLHVYMLLIARHEKNGNQIAKYFLRFQVYKRVDEYVHAFLRNFRSYMLNKVRASLAKKKKNKEEKTRDRN